MHRPRVHAGLAAPCSVPSAPLSCWMESWCLAERVAVLSVLSWSLPRRFLALRSPRSGALRNAVRILNEIAFNF